MNDISAQLAAKLQALWESSQSVILERAVILRVSQQQLAVNPTDAEARRRGGEAAHKLAGVLGVFGLPQGSRLASQIESLLHGSESDGSEPLTAENLQTLANLVESLDAVITSKASQTPGA